MTQRIEKTCIKKNAYTRNYRTYKSARDGFSSILDMLHMSTGDSVLLPGYIGWSANEGSGVFDPISSRNITPVFYHLDRELKIDISDCKQKIENCGAKIFLVIHYFGFVDPAAKELIEYAKNKGMTVIEDAAHALFSDRIGMMCGREGDYTLYSLHKMLPVNNGGMVVSNYGNKLPTVSYELNYDWSCYDFGAISNIRIRNFNLIEEQLSTYKTAQIIPLYKNLPTGVVPQTFPVILSKSNRDSVYFKMNEIGWGVVSLYHTMIENLRTEEFSNECWLSKHIINIPVHQDVDEDLINEMIEDFVSIVKEYNKIS